MIRLFHKILIGTCRFHMKLKRGVGINSVSQGNIMCQQALVNEMMREKWHEWLCRGCLHRAQQFWVRKRVMEAGVGS